MIAAEHRDRARNKKIPYNGNNGNNGGAGLGGDHAGWCPATQETPWSVTGRIATPNLAMNQAKAASRAGQRL